MSLSHCRVFTSTGVLCNTAIRLRKIGTLAKGTSRCLHVTCRRSAKSAETDLVKQLKAKIRFNGPITIAQYMKEVLTNPVSGYYMHRDVFGSQGDFITSPEISQMFGELIGIWCVNEWMLSGSPPHLQVVELGPGRGTLASDMLRVFSQFKEIKDRVSLHLVEVSPKLSEMQADRLGEPMPSSPTQTEVPPGDRLGEPMPSSPTQTEVPPGDKSYKKCHSKYGPEVSWYSQLPDVPRGFSFYVAHEFFDALPIHKFQKKDGRWHEMMVDIDESLTTDHHLRYVLSGGDTTALALLHQDLAQAPGDHLELCPEGGAIVQQLSSRIATDGGFALLADYGHSGEKTDTFRAFRKHQLFDPLCEPGTADLTADVDFSYLKKVAGNDVATYGPVMQEKFLQEMGIGVRLQVLMSKASPEERKNLATAYDMLTNREKMGERFKFFAMLQHRGGNYEPAGFTLAH